MPGLCRCVSLLRTGITKGRRRRVHLGIVVVLERVLCVMSSRSGPFCLPSMIPLRDAHSIRGGGIVKAPNVGGGDGLAG